MIIFTRDADRHTLAHRNPTYGQFIDNFSHQNCSWDVHIFIIFVLINCGPQEYWLFIPQQVVVWNEIHLTTEMLSSRACVAGRHLENNPPTTPGVASQKVTILVCFWENPHKTSAITSYKIEQMCFLQIFSLKSKVWCKKTGKYTRDLHLPGSLVQRP